MDATQPLLNLGGTGDSNSWQEWFQNLASYGLGRKWDSEYVEPFQPINTTQYVRDANGNLIPAGATVAPAAANHNLLLIGGVVIGGALLFMVLKD